MSKGGIGTLKVKPNVLESRRMRFQDNLVGEKASPKRSGKYGDHGSPSRIKGKCQEVEKEYLRLTEAADPALIRPLPVLKQALERVKARYLEEDNYAYACDQLKSIRQDLTVQGIKGRFTAHVYETHGRIALEQGDLSEYQACQVRLQEMAKSGTKIAYDEFTCYRLLYSLHVGSYLELQSVLSEIERGNWGNRGAPSSSAQEGSVIRTSIAFALEVIEAVRSRNTVRFFSLYKDALEHGQSVYILDFMLNAVREQATQSFVKAYQTYPLDQYASLLAFNGRQEAVSFLKEHQVVMRECEKVWVVDGATTRSSRTEAAEKTKKTKRRLDKKKRKEEERKTMGSSQATSILDRVGTPAAKKMRVSDTHTPASGSHILERLGKSSSRREKRRK